MSQGTPVYENRHNTTKHNPQYELTNTKQRGSLYLTEIILVGLPPIARQKFPRHFERYLETSATFQIF
jgi:hypothetical protein